MAWNGSGTFNRLYSWVADKAASINITASRMDDEFNNYKTGLENCLTRDGQTNPTADISMNSKKFTSVANATARDQFAAVGQVQDGSFIWCGTAGGTVDALTLTPTPAITSYTAGQEYTFLALGSNTVSPTGNISGLGVKNFKKPSSTGKVNLVAGDFISGQVIKCIYDGTDLVVYTLGSASAYTYIAQESSLIAVASKTFTGIDITGVSEVDILMDQVSGAAGVTLLDVQFNSASSNGTYKYQATINNAGALGSYTTITDTSLNLVPAGLTSATSICGKINLKRVLIGGGTSSKWIITGTCYDLSVGTKSWFYSGELVFSAVTPDRIIFNSVGAVFDNGQVSVLVRA